MKAIGSLCVVVALCGALALPAFGDATSKPIVDSNVKPVQLAYHKKDCVWHNGHWYCKKKHYNRGHHHCRYKQCWKGALSASELIVDLR